MSRTAVEIHLAEHPHLRVAGFSTYFDRPLGEIPSPPDIGDLLRLDAEAPLVRDEPVRGAVRDLLRWGGYKPTGRGKPASEYLVRAAADGVLTPINLAVDSCNAVSLHSGLPISVVDLELADPPFRVDLAPAGAAYVFNAAGQEIQLQGLVCLFDRQGPCANPVRDSQRTKTGETTTSTLSIVWAPTDARDRLDNAVHWYRSLLARHGARTAAVSIVRATRTGRAAELQS
jgi:DNA/RNA-binding domain of Phe-tRNA-synthetase-like protein